MSAFDHDPVDQFWHRFVASLPPQAEPPALYEAFQFGDNPALAEELAGLVLEGTKTATCGDLWSYEAEGQSLTPVGALSVVLDGSGQPVAVIETVEITVQRFDEVDERFARDEGEGDRSLGYWRAAHRSFFSRTLPAIGRSFAEDMPLVCERFRRVYP